MKVIDEKGSVKVAGTIVFGLALGLGASVGMMLGSNSAKYIKMATSLLSGFRLTKTSGKEQQIVPDK